MGFLRHLFTASASAGRVLSASAFSPVQYSACQAFVPANDRRDGLFEMVSPQNWSCHWECQKELYMLVPMTKIRGSLFPESMG